MDFLLRIWDETKKQMYYFSLQEYMVSNEQRQEKLVPSSANNPIMCSMNETDSVENLLYLSDYITDPKLNEYGQIIGNSIYEIVFVRGCFRFENIDKHEILEWEDLTYPIRIGNIYETLDIKGKDND